MAYFADPNITRPYELLQYADVTTGGAFGVTIILCVAIISFSGLYRSGWRSAFAATSFLTFTTASLLWLVEATNDTVMIGTILLILGAFAANQKWGDRF